MDVNEGIPLVVPERVPDTDAEATELAVEVATALRVIVGLSEGKADFVPVVVGVAVLELPDDFVAVTVEDIVVVTDDDTVDVNVGLPDAVPEPEFVVVEETVGAADRLLDTVEVLVEVTVDVNVGEAEVPPLAVPVEDGIVVKDD